jgi:hypothetical protein
MMQVDLDHHEWQQVLGLISEGPWRVANPLLMKIGEQLRLQPTPPPPQGKPIRTDGKEQHHE